LCLARAEHHEPQAPRGQGAMPLGLASTEGLGLARRATAWACEDAVSDTRFGALPLGPGDGGAARIRAAPTLDCAQTRQCRMRPNKPTEDDGPPRSAVFRYSTAAPSHSFVTCGSVVPTTSLLSLCFPISPNDAPAPRGVARRPVSSESAAASWLFSSRRQALILLEHCTACFARPNV